MSATAYPLTWPPHMPRTKQREAGQFRTKLPDALANVKRSLILFASDSEKKLEAVTISSNVTLGNQRPADPGVSVWFTWDGLPICIPVDRYTSIEGNLQAIHHIIEARRVELRHGTLALVRATFTGFKALPAPEGENWRAVLGIRSDVDPTREAVQEAYRRLAAVRHPDVGGGSESAMAELNAARDAALREIAG